MKKRTVLTRVPLWGAFALVILLTLAVTVHQINATPPMPGEEEALPVGSLHNEPMVVEGVSERRPLLATVQNGTAGGNMSENFEGPWPGIGWGLVESTMYSQQGKALKLLAAVLWQKEQVEKTKARQQVVATATKLPPFTYTRLFGVTEQLNRLARALDDTSGRWLVVVDGLGGMGKTVLACEATRLALVRGRFADLAWVTAQQERFEWGGRQAITGSALNFETLLDTIAGQLGYPEIRRQPLEKKKADIRFLLSEESYLIVVDNLETAADFQGIVAGLWALANPSKILVTSRHQLTGYTQAHALLTVGPLSEADALAFMHYHTTEERGLTQVAKSPETTFPHIFRLTGGNPLAIKLVIGQLARLPAARVLADLQEARGVASELYTFIYDYSWNQLSAAAQLLLLNMPHLPVTGGDWNDLLVLSGLNESELTAAVNELVDFSLLNVGREAERQYSIHQLTRQYVLSELVETGANETPPDEPFTDIS